MQRRVLTSKQTKLQETVIYRGDKQANKFKVTEANTICSTNLRGNFDINSSVNKYTLIHDPDNSCKGTFLVSLMGADTSDLEPSCADNI